MRWLVDPLDGTINYLWGVPQWCVSVAALDADGPLVGVVHDPSRERDLHRRPRRGRAPGRRRAAASRPGAGWPRRSSAPASATAPSSAPARPRLLPAMLPAVRDVRRFGSAALDLRLGGRRPPRRLLRDRPQPLGLGGRASCSSREAGGVVEELRPRAARWMRRGAAGADRPAARAGRRRGGVTRRRAAAAALGGQRRPHRGHRDDGRLPRRLRRRPCSARASTSTPSAGGWRALQVACGSTFLFVVGVSLAISNGRGARPRALGLAALPAPPAPRRPGGRRGPAGQRRRRWIALGDDYVRFGILHCIAVAMVVGPLLLRARVGSTCSWPGRAASRGHRAAARRQRRTSPACSCSASRRRAAPASTGTRCCPGSPRCSFGLAVGPALYPRRRRGPWGRAPARAARARGRSARPGATPCRSTWCTSRCSIPLVVAALAIAGVEISLDAFQVRRPS